MSRITLQTKGFLSLACAACTAIGFSFAANRWDQPNGKWVLPGVIGLVCFGLQSDLLFVDSKEEIELAQYKRLDSAKLEDDVMMIENKTRMRNAATERVSQEIRSGNLEEAKRWSDFWRDHHGQ